MFNEGVCETFSSSMVKESIVLYKELEKRIFLLNSYRSKYTKMVLDKLVSTGVCQSIEEATSFFKKWHITIEDFHWKPTTPERTFCKYSLSIKSPYGALFQTFQQCLLFIKQNECSDI